MKSKKWVMAKHFKGFPKDSDFKLVEEELPELVDGDVLLEAVFLSVDPYMRPYMMSLPEGDPMIGEQVCRVVQSRNGEFPLGSYYTGAFGWSSYNIYNASGEGSVKPFTDERLTPDPAFDIGALPKSHLLGALGMPGCTAYFGLLKLCDPKPGETVLVNAAAGAVGSLVGQIAKIKGCTVIGYAGTDAKVAWIKELGFDHAFNYKTCDLDATLKQAAPEGIDCYFDNVGGDFSSTVIANHMKIFGRIALCGAISGYNAEEAPKGTYPFWHMIPKQLKMEGFIVHRWLKEWPMAIKQMLQWIQEGKLKHNVHVTEGFENMPHAFQGLLRGENIGKAIVKA